MLCGQFICARKNWPQRTGRLPFFSGQKEFAYFVLLICNSFIFEFAVE
jgi:hypothetical protein